VQAFNLDFYKNFVVVEALMPGPQRRSPRRPKGRSDAYPSIFGAWHNPALKSRAYQMSVTLPARVAAND
jgi:hypothetical protein